MRDKSTGQNSDHNLRRIAVEVVTLPPMTVATVVAFGPHPEQEAWRLLLAWARAHGLETELGRHHFYGFNNPDPVPGKADYGYEQWMTLDEPAPAEPPVAMKTFAGGRFLTTCCAGLENLSPTWQRLFRWCQHRAFDPEFDRPFLEECLTPLACRPGDFAFRLLLPVSAAAHAAPTSQAA